MILYDSLLLCMILHSYARFCMIPYSSVWFCMILHSYVWFCIVMYDSVCFRMIFIINRHYIPKHHCQFRISNCVLCGPNKTDISVYCRSTSQASDIWKMPQIRRCAQSRILPLGTRLGQTHSHHILVTNRPARSLAVQSQTKYNSVTRSFPASWKQRNISPSVA
jgi:hypothetical protein